MRRAALVILLTVALACAPQPGAGPEVDDADAATPAGTSVQEFSNEANLRALNSSVADFARLLMEEDLNGFMDLYTDDAIRLPPDAPAIEGADAIRAAQYRQFENVDQTITIRMDESEFSGDLAFVRGSFAVTQTFADGTSADFVGSWMNLMRRSPDGQWRIHRNIWNRDQPPT